METAGPWQSVEDCMAGLSRIHDAGGYARADAYAYLYGRLEATADQEETPAELRGVVGAQHGPTLVQHIAGALRATVLSPVEHAEQASKYLPLLTVLLNHDCCCRALDAQQQSVGPAAAGGVLDTLLDVLLAGQEKLAAIDSTSTSSGGAVNSPPPSSAAAAAGGSSNPPPPPTAASSSSSPGGSSSTPLADREARVVCLPLAELCLQLLDALAYQRCDLSHLPPGVLQKLVRAMALAIDGGFGPLCQTLPAQGLHAATRLLPRIAPLRPAAVRSRGLLKAILRRALSVPNVPEAGMAVDALRLAMQAGLLKRDPMGSGQAETYHRCVTEFWNEEAYERLKKAEPITALRLTGVLMQVLDPDKMGRMLRRQLWPTISGFLHTKEEADTARALQREAAGVWSSYVTALAQQWFLLKAAKKQNLEPVVQFLGVPAHFMPLYRPPSEGTMELESQMLALLNTLLAMTEWRELLWPSPGAGGAQPRQQKQQQQQQQAGGGHQQQQQQEADLQHVVLTLLRTDHSGEEADLRMLRFDAGLACLSQLVPGAVPPVLHLLEDASLCGWRPVVPLDQERQLSLLSAAIPILANQSALLRHFELEAEAAAARRHQPPQSQLGESADAPATATALRPPLEQRPTALRPLLACWAYLLQRLLPSALAAAPATNPAAAAAIVDGALGVLRLAPATAAHLAALQLLADEALAILGPSQLVVPAGSTLWAAVAGKVYTAPPGGPVVRLGMLALGCKALLLNYEALATTATTAPAAPLRLPVGDGGLALPQLVDFLDGLLARLVATSTTDPRPWLRMHYACLVLLLAQPSSTPYPKEAHALALRVLRMLPTFATRGGAAAAFDSHDALRAEAGGPILDLWSNLLGRCLAWAEAPHAHTHAAAAAVAAASSQSQSQLAGWETEDPAQAIKAVADAVLAPLLPPAAAPTSSRALAVLWCPLAWKALRCLNTSLNQRSGGRSSEAQRTRAALLAPALGLATALLSALQPATARDRGAKGPCLCNACGLTVSSGGSGSGSGSNTWLSVCLRPAPAAEEWTLEAVEAMAQALAGWCGGKGAAAGACRTALAKEAASATRRFLDSLVQGAAGGGGSRRQSLGGGGGAAAASQSLLQAAPGEALLALQPLLLALLAKGGDEGKECVQVLWQGGGLGKRADLGLAGDGAQALRGALQQLVRSGAIASLDTTLGGAGAEAGGLAAVGNGNSGGGRRPPSSGSSGGSSVVKKRPSSSGGGGGAAEGESASKRAK